MRKRPAAIPLMAKAFRWLSVVLFLAALIGIAVLLVSDFRNHLWVTPIHQRSGALALILIGASYISFQAGAENAWRETLKGVLLGVAFLLWGGEQFLPSGPWVTAIDSMVITIFVVDLSLIILAGLRRGDH